MPNDLERHDAVVVSDGALADLLNFANRLADASGAVIRPHFRAKLEVRDKGGTADYDPVTIADWAAETELRRLIHEHYPEHGIFGEEHGFERGLSGLTWVIDPIDGTRAFITGLPLWGTLIALYDGRAPIIGVMDQPYTRERFVASCHGAEMHTEQGVHELRTRPCPDLSKAVLQTTHPSMFTTPQERAAYAEIERRVRLTRFGGDCYAYCMLAHGLIDLVIESSLAPYDVQALIPIVEAAGGVMTNWAGDSAAQGGQIIACGDPDLHTGVLKLLSSGVTHRARESPYG